MRKIEQDRFLGNKTEGVESTDLGHDVGEEYNLEERG